MRSSSTRPWLEAVGLAGAVGGRDGLSRRAFGRSTSDAGAVSETRESRCLEFRSIREILDRPRTQARWADGSNMIPGRPTKNVPADHLRETLERGTQWIELGEERARTARRVVQAQRGNKVRELVKDGKFSASLVLGEAARGLYRC